jgi:septal ring factor EnvC (AmiA/AmiB activator)
MRLNKWVNPNISGILDILKSPEMRLSGNALEGVPVHALADGIVKQVSHNCSWGSMAVIETISPAGDTLCAIYGHLSRFINVNTGDVVKMGDKIGQIGNSVSYENGGYWAHRI